MKRILILLICLILLMGMIGCDSNAVLISDYVEHSITDEFVLAFNTGKTLEFISTHFISNM